jgi:predicted transcriptional regulator
MGKMMHMGLNIDEAMMADLESLARATDRSPEALVHDAIGKMLEDDAAMTAFVQAGIDSLENEPLIDHQDVVAWVAERRRTRSAK